MSKETMDGIPCLTSKNKTESGCLRASAFFPRCFLLANKLMGPGGPDPVRIHRLFVYPNGHRFLRRPVFVQRNLCLFLEMPGVLVFNEHKAR